VVVPDSRYCGACGAHLAHEASGGARRLHSYAAFPDEPVVRLSVATTLFPHLSHRARVPFRAALGVIVGLLLVFALAGTTAPLIAVCGLGVPLLFLLYIIEVDPYEGTFVLPTALALVLGAGLGAGWALIASPFVDLALQPTTAASLTSAHALVAAIIVPTVAQLLMCVPVVVVRSMQRGRPESLDGFVAGATGALGFTCAATLVLLSPLLRDGQLTHQSFLVNMSQAIERGLGLPLISAMATGLIGGAIWVSRGRTTSARGRWVTSPVLAFVLAEVIQIGWAFGNLAALPDADVILIQLAAIAAIVVSVRLGIHHVLIHEAVDTTVGAPRVCPHCGHLVPTTSFCPQCGVADRALARSGRSEASAPQSAADPSEAAGFATAPTGMAAGEPWPTSPPGEATMRASFPVVRPPAPHGHRLGHLATVALLLAGLAVLTAVLLVVGVFAPPAPPAPCPPLGCQAPPLGKFAAVAQRASQSGLQLGGRLYTNPQGFTVRYYPFPDSSLYPGVETSAKGIQLSYPFKASYGGAAYLDVVGAPDDASTAQQIVNKEVSQIAPNAQLQYVMPQAYLGYVPGYGAAFETEVPNADGHSATYQLLVMASVQNGFAIAVVASGELLSRVTPGSTWWDGHPSPAAISVAYLADSTVNGIAFPGRR
jgi:RsiW-degrading membrane proteinase PrsW (M82 family)